MINAKLILIGALLAVTVIVAQEKPHPAEIDRIRLAEAFRLSDTLSERVWKSWKNVTCATLLVTPEYEFLVRHPRPSEDFTLIGYDSLLKGDVYSRKRQFSINFLAAFPAVGGISTVVIGQAENTNKKTSTPWVVTVLHEHFHQLQESQSNYFAEVEALNLSRGDNTGMWMLNYAFPYDSHEVIQQFANMTQLLSDTLQSKTQPEFSKNLAAYLAERQKLKEVLSSDDYKYFSFQIWKEGIARYTEYRVAKLAAEDSEPDKQFRALKDFESYETVANQIKSSILNELSTYRIENDKRELFYSIGGGEGLLLDKVNPNWQDRYFEDKFYIENYFKP
jgi:hypothetical protein